MRRSVWERLRRSKDGHDSPSPEDDEAHRRSPRNGRIRLDGGEHTWWAGVDEAPTAEAPDGEARARFEHAHGPRTAEELREAFTRKRRSRAEEEPCRPRDAFSAYYSADSLFSSVQDPDPPSEVFAADDPYAVLGVPMEATWEQIVVAHRRLAKLHHPDRLRESSEADREASETRMRDVNIAYEELKRRRGK